ncbi:hypothetical protein ACFCXH_01845 [Streptomyces nojiriensis]|uniref:hypothetical protein n=1 Tax=Streptomyces nojiriensis TaxID=66374 RepID=UPI0035DC5DE7
MRTALDTWDEDTFYGLLEVLHDLISRPWRRRFYSCNSPGRHPSEFHNEPTRFPCRAKGCCAWPAPSTSRLEEAET